MREFWLIFFIYLGHLINLPEANAAPGTNPFYGILGNLTKVRKTDPGIEYLRMWMDPDQDRALSTVIDQIESLEGRLEAARGIGRTIIQKDLDSAYAQFVKMMRVYVDDASALLTSRGVAHDVVNIGDEARPYFVIKIRPVKNGDAFNQFALDAKVNTGTEVIFDPIFAKSDVTHKSDATFLRGMNEDPQRASRPQIVVSLDSIVDQTVTKFEWHELEHAAKADLIVRGHPSPYSAHFSRPGHKASKLSSAYASEFSPEEIHAYWIQNLGGLKKFFTQPESMKTTNEFANSMVRELDAQLAFIQESAINTDLTLQALNTGRGKLVTKYVLRGDPERLVEIPFFKVTTLDRPPLTTEIPLPLKFVGATQETAKAEAEKTLLKLQQLLIKRNQDLNAIKSQFIAMTDVGFEAAKSIYQNMLPLIDEVTN